MTERAPTTLHLARAWVDDRIAADVVVTLADGRMAEVRTDVAEVPTGAVHVDGVALPGLVNAHSHAFHRLLRARTQDRTEDGSFWSWRDQMYELAATLDRDQLLAVARAVFAEMALAGITCVGEFHYLHHRIDGTPYADPNELGRVVVRAAAEAGIRMTLLDTVYLASGIAADGTWLPPDTTQRRFVDRDVATWAERTSELADSEWCRHGAAVHSVRAVPPQAMARVAEVVRSRGWVLHAHVAEQRREVDQCRTATGRTPLQVMADTGVVTDTFTAVHGVWLDDDDVATLAAADATVCACPTTERDLADGVVSARRLADAGVRIALGSDSHAVVDLLEEARAVELDQRLVTGRRGLHDPSELLDMATRGGATSLGWPDGGRIEVGALADLCVVGIDSTRLAGTAPTDLLAAIVFAATAGDVSHTMVGGRWVVVDGTHLDVDVAGDLQAARGPAAPANRSTP